MPHQIAVLVGSLRRESINRRLAEALTRLPEAQGHAFAFADIAALPPYDQDDDDDQAAPVRALKDLVAGCEGVLFVSPEYNRSIPGVLKNAIDHGSRPHGKGCWAGKSAGIVGASIGKPGTAMMQQHLRNVLAYLDMPVLGQPEAMIQWQDGMVGKDHEIANADTRTFLSGWMKAFLGHVDAHRAAD